MRAFVKLVIGFSLLLPLAGVAKGNGGSGGGYWMVGTVTNVTMLDGHIHFQLNGWFYLWQSPYNRWASHTQGIKVDCTHGMWATVTPYSFFAMTSDWSGGSVQKEERLLQILQTAADRSRIEKFELMYPKIDFGTNGFTLMDARVLRVTDADLR